MSPPIAQLLFPNRIDASTLSGGGWSAPFPLANLQDRRLSLVARSANAALASTKFDVALDRTRSIDALVLVATNLSTDASITVTLASDPSFSSGTTLLATTAPAYPASQHTLDLHWSDSNWWSGRPTTEDLASLGRTSIVLLPKTVLARYVRVEIADTANPETYVQVGRAFVSSAWTPDHNYDFGAALEIGDLSTNDRAIGGGLYFDKRPRYRTQSVAFTNLYETGFSTIFDILRTAGQTEEAFWIPDSTDTLNLLRRCFLCRIREPSKLEQAAFLRQNVGLVLEELL